MGPPSVNTRIESSRPARPRSGRGGRLAALALGLAAALLGPGRAAVAAAPRAIEVEDCRVGFDGRYKVGCWTPVFALLRGGPDGFAGEMLAVVEDENGTPTTVRQPVQIGPGGTQRVTAYVRPGSLSSDFGSLRFVDGKTGRLAVPPVVIGDLAASGPTAAGAGPAAVKLVPVGQGDYQLVTLGHPYGVEGIPALPGYNATPGNPNNGRALEVAVAQVDALGAADRLPGRWLGYDSADAVIIDTNDAETLATLSGGRIEAIRQWVQRGGHLVVAASSRIQAVNDGPLADLLPARLVGQTQVTPFDALESFTGGAQQGRFENAPTQAAKLEDVEARGGRVLAQTLSTPLVVRGPYGFGRVTLVALDVDAKPFSAWPDRNLFWVKALDLKTPAGAAGINPAASQQIFNQNVSDLSTLVRRSLDQFRGMTVIPFGWVAGFIALYILLIGPGDYFFLKKVLKRMELTWITFPTIVVAVSLIAYFAAYRIKGTDLRVNQVDVVDVDLAARVTRGTTWLNLFSPQNRDYSIGVVPQPVGADARAAAPTPGTDVTVSWFAAPESGLRGMNTRGQGVGFAGSGYDYAPSGRAERLEGVRIGIWSTKGVLARWFGPAPTAGSILDVDLVPVGTDRLAGTVTNRLDVPLRDAILCFNKQVYYQIGTIEPGATVQVDSTLNRTLGNHLESRRKNFIPANQFGNGAATIARGDLAREMMFHDSDASGQETVPSRVHRDLDLTGQLALDRPMLVAEVDRPGATLDLGGPGAIKTDRTTVLRLILPLKSETPANPSPKGPQP